MPPILHEIDTHPLPDGDGWGWLYRSFERLAPPGRRLRQPTFLSSAQETADAALDGDARNL